MCALFGIICLDVIVLKRVIISSPRYSQLVLGKDGFLEINIWLM